MGSDRRRAIIDFFNHDYPWWQQVYEYDLPRGFFSFEMIRRRERVLETVNETLKERHGLRILECGCGPGGLLGELPAGAGKVYGLDINLCSLASARERNRQAVPVCGDIEQLPFTSESFDMILCIGVLSYLRGDERAVTEMVRLLKPGGQLLVAIPNFFMLDKFLDPFYLLVWPFRKLSLWFGRAGGQDPEQFTTEMIRRYRYGQLDGLFRNAGLVRRELTGTSYGPLRFWRREWLPVERSIRISDTMVRMADRQPFEFLVRMANHWVTCLEKPACTARSAHG